MKKFKKLSTVLFLSLVAIQAPVSADGVIEDSKNVSSEELTHDKKKSEKSKVGNSVALSKEELAKYQYCGKDSDCVAVINGCCQCLQGDSYVAIAKNMYESFKSKFNCDSYTCAKEESSRHCTEGVVSCINHSCTYFDSFE